MPNIISERTTMSQGMPITVTTVNGMDRVEINNKLHKLGDQLLKLKMQQQALIEMRNQIDRQNEIIEMGDLFDEMFGGWRKQISLILHTMEISTYNFSGDAVTFLGLVGVVSTGIILVTVFRRYWNSPLRK